MVSVVLLLVIVVIVIVALLKHARDRPENFPPGPYRIPLVGSYFHYLANNYKFPHKGMASLIKKYKSKIIGLYIGGFQTVLVADPFLIRDVLLRPEFDGRIFSFAVKIRQFYKKVGIFFTDGPFWLEQRRFTLRYMRDFGFGRRMTTLEDITADEIKDMLSLIQNGSSDIGDKKIVRGNHEVCIPDIFYSGLANCYIAILMGKPFPKEKREYLREVSRAGLEFQRSLDAAGGILSILPWLRFFAPNMSRYRPIIKWNQVLLDCIEEIIAICKKNLRDEDNNGFIDVYLKENSERAVGAEEYSTFSEQQLHVACTDLLLPSVSANSTSLAFLVQYLLLHPEIQEQMYQEIKHVVGVGRLPTLNDRKDLPYCEATLRESMRIVSLAPWGVPHRATEDTTLGEYSIPKDTVVMLNLWYLHNDEDHWHNPKEFRPERFLTEHGELIKKDPTLPFGLGRRVCAGETFARNTLFLFMTALVQSYQLHPAAGNKIKLDPLDCRTGLINNVDEFWIQCKPR